MTMKTPGDKSADHIQGTMGKIGYPAGTVNQGKSQGYQGQGNAVNRTVNEYFKEYVHDKI
jgi:hypothetical protein